MSKPTLYIMCGLPFSGKSLLVMKLSKKLEIPAVSIDTIRFSKGFQWTDTPLSQKEWKAIFDESYNQTLEFLNKGKSVLYDSANQDRISRDRLRRVVFKGGYSTKVIFMNVSEQTVRERWRNNQVEKYRFHIPEEFFQAAIDSFERPTEDENVIEYKEGDDFESWFRKNSQYFIQ